MKISRDRIALLIICGNFVLLSWIAWLDTEFVVDRIVQDDAFYYLKIAQNISRGEGATFDQIHPTNGFHPLLMVVLVPLFLVFPNNLELPLQLLLMMSSLFNLLILVYLYKVTFLIGGRKPALLAMFIWAFGVTTVTVSVNGMESSLYCMLLLLTIYFYINYFVDQPTWFHSVYLGIFAGLTALARLDALFLLVAFSCLFLFDKRAAWHTRLRIVFSFALPVGFLIGPYLLWNLIRFGHLMPVSGQAHFIYSMWGELGKFSLFEWVGMLGQPINFLLPYLTLMVSKVNYLFPESINSMTLKFLPVALYSGMLLFLWKSDKNCFHRCFSKLSGIKVFGLFLVFHYLFYTLYFMTIRPYYFMPEKIFVIILQGLTLGLITDKIAAKFNKPLVRKVETFAFVTVILTFVMTDSLVTARYVSSITKHVTMYHGALWLRDSTDEDAVIGSFNSGIIGYFSGRKVINLDGVVNDYDFLKFHRNKSIEKYWEDQRIDYLVDFFPKDPLAEANPAEDYSYRYTSIQRVKQKLELVHIIRAKPTNTAKRDIYILKFEAKGSSE